MDYADLDFPALMRDCGIRTVCLDEAHHLQNEWQRALETFLQKCEGITVISLTATPPYDASFAEWKRYVGVCGEIDEEIFVPELVKAGNLCPHQDYVCFSYPEKSELRLFESYRREAEEFLDELIGLPFVRELPGRLDLSEEGLDALFEHIGGVLSLFSLLKSKGVELPQKAVRILSGGRLPPSTPARSEQAIRFLLEGGILTEEERETVRELLKKRGLFERGRAAIDLNETLRRKLISSVGKLKSLPAILACEKKSLKERLRMLILTDHIKKESLSIVGSQDPFRSISVVSLFETARRAEPDLPIGALSGSLVILPKACASLPEIGPNCSLLGETGYAVFDLGSTNREKVEKVGRLFENGTIRVLIGTRSLLGEGWDSPCINSLVLASFVGSFMLSNQMRGRAIRTDKKDPEKTANIWHLIALEPARMVRTGLGKLAETGTERTFPESADFETAARRFQCFMGPDYQTCEIESGIDRLSFIQPPYDRKGVERINQKMLEAAGDREALRKKWERGLEGKTETARTGKAEKGEKQPSFVFINFLLLFLLTTLDSILLAALIKGVILSLPTLRFWGILGAIVLLGLFFRFSGILFRRVIACLNPAHFLRTMCRCVLKTFQEEGMISPDAAMAFEAKADGLWLQFSLRNATAFEQNLFVNAVTELLSPIQNPRFLLIRRRRPGGWDCSCSFACPSVIGRDKKMAERLAAHLRAGLGRIQVVYTRNKKGRQLILKCRRRSFLTRNRKCVDPKFKVSRWE